MFDTNFVFTSGKLTTVLDGGAGSSGKGKLGSFLCSHAQNWQFACNTFMPQSGHYVELESGRRVFYQTFNSCAYEPDRYEKLYIGPGATIELEAFFKELEENRIPATKVGISELTSVLQDCDKGYERGELDIAGNPLPERVPGGPLLATGSTMKGCGANRARRLLRLPSAKFARDEPRLKEFICDVPGEIMRRLDGGQAGLLEVAQGFQLSYLLPSMYPSTTSRNCTVAAGLDDLMIPPVYAGNVVLNFRTYPIRISNNKYQDTSSNDYLTWVQVIEKTGGPDAALRESELEKYGVRLLKGNSGGGYGDQEEISWEGLAARLGTTELIHELSSVTKLPRRLFTFSRKNVEEAIRHNRAAGAVYLSLNFANYVDPQLKGHRSRDNIPPGSPLIQWLDKNLAGYREQLKFIGTGARTDDMIQIG